MISFSSYLNGGDPLVYTGDVRNVILWVKGVMPGSGSGTDFVRLCIYLGEAS